MDFFSFFFIKVTSTQLVLPHCRNKIYNILHFLPVDKRDNERTEPDMVNK